VSKTLTSKGTADRNQVVTAVAGEPFGSPYHSAITALFDLPLSPLPADEDTSKKTLF